MGNCSSWETIRATTAKLIFQDGELEEFSSPIKVFEVIMGNPECFICDSAELDFNEIVPAMGGDEELQLGELYFALPLSWLDQPLLAEDMATLAVRASLALAAGSGGGGGTCGGFRKRVNPHASIFGGDGSVVMGDKRARGHGGEGGSSGGGGGGGKLTRKLSMILEE